MCLFRITKTGINPLESIKAEPAVMLPVGDKKIHNPVSLRVVYVIYREKEIVCAASANMDMLISLCSLAYPLLCIFYFFSSSGMTGIAPFCVQTYALTLTPMR